MCTNLTTKAVFIGVKMALINFIYMSLLITKDALLCEDTQF